MELVLGAYDGLGNQLFRYAALLYYSKRLKATKRIAAQPPRFANSFGYPRPFLLSHYSIKTPITERSLVDRLLLSPEPWLKTVSTPLRLAVQAQVFTQEPSAGVSCVSDIPVGRHTRRVYLDGYWQSAAMVEEVATELRSELILRQAPQGKNLDVWNQIKSCRNPVSVHVRRGDTPVAATTRIVLPIEYYLKGIFECQRLLASPTFFVFSDDMAFAKNYLPRPINAVFVDHNDDFTAHEDLRLMSSCHHHIVANSTFSWWGAWLSDCSDKIVFTPKRWFLTRESDRPELPPSWTQVDVAVEGKSEF